MRSVCHSLPHENLVNLRYLIKFLDRLCALSEANKMSAQNVAMAITPSLIWAPVAAGEEDSTAKYMTATNLHSVIVYSLLSNASFFFPEGESCLQVKNKDRRSFCRCGPDESRGIRSQ